MSPKFLSKLKDRFVELTYSHRWQQAAQMHAGYVLDVIGQEGHEVLVLVTWGEKLIPGAPQASVPGTMPSQSNVQSATDKLGEYRFLFLDAEGVLSCHVVGKLTYRYDTNNPEALSANGPKLTQRKEAEHDHLYPLSHTNREAFSALVLDTLRKEFAEMGLNGKPAPEPVSEPALAPDLTPEPEPEVVQVPVEDISVEPPVKEE